MPDSRDHLVFEVRLDDVEPAPWRRFSLPAEGTFHDLHRAIQAACGWSGTRLWAFEDEHGDDLAGPPPASPADDAPDARAVPLAEGFRRRRACTYVYDFGDDWRHTVRLVQHVLLDAPAPRRLLAGELRFPPEDCGGPEGYARCVAIARGAGDPWDELHDAEARAWLGDWSPDDFDLAAEAARFAEPRAGEEG